MKIRSINCQKDPFDVAKDRILVKYQGGELLVDCARLTRFTDFDLEQLLDKGAHTFMDCHAGLVMRSRVPFNFKVFFAIDHTVIERLKAESDEVL